MFTSQKVLKASDIYEGISVHNNWRKLMVRSAITSLLSVAFNMISQFNSTKQIALGGRRDQLPNSDHRGF